MGGSCCNRKVDAVNSIVKKTSEISPLDKMKVDFSDMEVYPDVEVGLGIFRSKGYKCTLPYNKLVELRNDFWTEISKRVAKYLIIAIRHACINDTSNY
jgi:hypothetical protein